MSISRLIHQICLIYIFIFPLTTSRVNEHYPPLWIEAPSSISDYPLAENCSKNCRLINPWIYLHRLGLYKILINTTSPLMPFCSSSTEANVLFGLPTQFGWQLNTNRLFTNGTEQISTDSWWASMNYYLSVIPFLAAVDAGIIRPQDSFEIVQSGNFCTNYTDCFRQVPDAMNKWRVFFAKISQGNYCKNESIGDRMIDECYLGPMWSAHFASVDNALPLTTSKLPLLPSEREQQFGLGWANFVAFISMARLNVNLSNTNTLQEEFLPNRTLTNEDHPPHCSDLSKDVNQALELLLFIQPQWDPELMKLWKQATCNYESRRDAQVVLQTMPISVEKAMIAYSEAIVKSHMYRCDQ